MKPFSPTIVSICALAVLAGCASSDVASRRSYTADEEIAKVLEQAFKKRGWI